MTLVTPSKWLAGLVKESFLKDYPVEVINNGIDTCIFKPTPSDFRKRYHIEDKKVLLGVAAFWDKRKGLNDFVKLSKMLDDDYKIVLVGLSEKQIKEVPDNIIKISRTNSAVELEDNYPTVNLEAQACGTPVITYDTGGSVESVPEENVVECGDVNEVKTLLLTGLLPMHDICFDKKNCLKLYLDI